MDRSNWIAFSDCVAWEKRNLATFFAWMMLHHCSLEIHRNRGQFGSIHCTSLEVTTIGQWVLSSFNSEDPLKAWDESEIRRWPFAAVILQSVWFGMACGRNQENFADQVSLCNISREYLEQMQCRFKHNWLDSCFLCLVHKMRILLCAAPPWNLAERPFWTNARWVVLFVMSCVLLLQTLVWLNAVRFLFAFDTARDGYAVMFQKLIYGCISWQYAIGLTAFVYYHYKHIPNFIAKWEEYKNKHGGSFCNHHRFYQQLVPTISFTHTYKLKLKDKCKTVGNKTNSSCEINLIVLFALSFRHHARLDEEAHHQSDGHDEHHPRLFASRGAALRHVTDDGLGGVPSRRVSVPTRRAAHLPGRIPRVPVQLTADLRLDGLGSNCYLYCVLLLLAQTGIQVCKWSVQNGSREECSGEALDCIACSRWWWRWRRRGRRQIPHESPKEPCNH